MITFKHILLGLSFFCLALPASAMQPDDAYPTFGQSMISYYKNNPLQAIARGILSGVQCVGNAYLAKVCLQPLMPQDSTISAKSMMAWTAVWLAPQIVYEEYKNIKEYQRASIVIMASLRGDYATVSKLFKAHSKITDVECTHGDVRLHCAAAGGNADCIRLLLSKGDGVDKENDDGTTPLYYATKLGRLQAAKALIDAGAYIGAEGKEGATPYSLAVTCVRPDILLYMLQNAQLPVEAKECGQSIERIDTAITELRKCKLTEEVICMIISFLPQDICTKEHMEYVLPYSFAEQLVTECPLAWFKERYISLPPFKRTALLEKIIPELVDMRMVQLSKLANNKHLAALPDEEIDPAILAVCTPEKKDELAHYTHYALRREFAKLILDKYPALRAIDKKQTLQLSVQENHGHGTRV